MEIICPFAIPKAITPKIIAIKQKILSALFVILMSPYPTVVMV